MVRIHLLPLWIHSSIWLEQATHNRQAGCSNQPESTEGGVALMVELGTENSRVDSSILSPSTNGVVAQFGRAAALHAEG